MKKQIYFDKHEWKAELYKGEKEILKTLKTLDGKKINSVKVIGAAFSIGDVPFGEMFRGNHNSPSVPAIFSTTEPVSISFTDGTTIEIKIKSNNEWYIGFNSIPEYICDGTNHNNLNADLLFKNLKGVEIRDVSMKKLLISDEHENITEEIIKYLFYTYTYDGDPVGFSLVGKGSYCTMAMTNGDWFYSFGNCIAPVTREEYKAALKGGNQFYIVEGHDSGAAFWINPVRINEKENKIIENTDEEISIDEDIVENCLFCFLNKNFNKPLSLKYRKIDGCDYFYDGFEDHLIYNIYTCEDLKSMLADIKVFSDLLYSVQSITQLTGLKKESPYSNALCIFDYGYPDITEENLRERINCVVDFYERFIRRMEAMIKVTPPGSHISFIGP